MTATAPKLMIASLGVVGLFWPSPAGSPAVTRASHQVRIAHQLVHAGAVVTETPVAPPRAVRVAARITSRRPEAARKPVGIAARTGRMFIGDGRYRPEPFPTPGR